MDVLQAQFRRKLMEKKDISPYAFCHLLWLRLESQDAEIYFEFIQASAQGECNMLKLRIKR